MALPIEMVHGTGLTTVEETMSGVSASRRAAWSP
jgi:hypothetical protein